MVENTDQNYEIEEINESQNCLIDSDGYALISFKCNISDNIKLSFSINNYTNEYVAIVIRDRLKHVLSVNLLEGYKSIEIKKVSSFVKKPKDMVIKRPDDNKYTRKCNWWYESDYIFEVCFLRDSKNAKIAKEYGKLENYKIRYELVSESEVEEIKKVENNDDSDEESDDPGGFTLFDDSDDEDEFQKPEPEEKPKVELKEKNNKKVRKPCEPFDIEKNPINFRTKRKRHFIKFSN